MKYRASQKFSGMFLFTFRQDSILLADLHPIISQMYKKTLCSEEQQVSRLIKTIAFFWCITKIWSYKTWVTDRLYPVIPPADFLKYVPDFLHVFLFGFSVLALLVLLFVKANRLLLISLFLSELLSCSLDTVRWQPWEYMYMCFLLIIVINLHRPKRILMLGHLFLVSVYFFSGLHKLSRGFLSSIWMNMVLMDFFGLSMEAILKYKLYFIGLLIPFTEILLAVLLFISESKRKISYLLILTHISILIFIGPFGIQYNSVVWPWNLAMISILIVVYAKPVEPIRREFFITNSYWIVLWFVLPVLSFFGSWYQYFSFNLYSGKGEHMYIYFSEKQKELRPYFEPGSGNRHKNEPYIILQNWAMKEIRSAPVPETEMHREIAISLRRRYHKRIVRIMLYNPQTGKITEL